MLFPLLLSIATAMAAPSAPHRFFANQEIQAQAPAAFALQKEGMPALRAAAEAAPAERARFLEQLRSDASLGRAIENFSSLPEPQRLETMRTVFEAEVRALGIKAPELVIENGVIPGPAFFDFDPEKPGPGRVILNPQELEKLSPYAALSLLIHETKHSAQFQLAYSSRSPLALGYRAAFEAQKKIKGMSFCDFTTLLNEYEAFQFANYVLGALTGFRLNLLDMGNFASQYGSDGKLKIDLLGLADSGGSETLLVRFNELEKVQYRQLGGKE